MARTLEELDAAVTALERKLSTSIEPQISELEAAVQSFRSLWRGLRSGRIESEDSGAPSIQLPEPLPETERIGLRWISSELAKSRRR